jgi:hypothetical protein
MLIEMIPGTDTRSPEFFMFARPASGPMISDPICRAADVVREGIRRRVHVTNEPAMRDAFLRAGEIEVARNTGNRDLVLKVFDDMLSGLLSAFGEADPRHIRRAIPRGRGCPQPVERDAFPVALVAELLNRRKIRIDTSRLTNWKPFAARYGAAIMVH